MLPASVSPRARTKSVGGKSSNECALLSGSHGAHRSSARPPAEAPACRARPGGGQRRGSTPHRPAPPNWPPGRRRDRHGRAEPSAADEAACRAEVASGMCTSQGSRLAWGSKCKRLRCRQDREETERDREDVIRYFTIFRFNP